MPHRVYNHINIQHITRNNHIPPPLTYWSFPAKAW